jgi:hypothetical protein
MGTMQAMSLAEGIQEGWVDLDGALAMHLQSNHYPPLPLAYIGLCKVAIEEAAYAVASGDDDRWATRLDIPEGVNPRPAAEEDGTITVATAVDIFHLDAFVDSMLASFDA